MLASELAWAQIQQDGALTRAVELLESARSTFRELNDDVNYAIAGDRLIHATSKGPGRDALRTSERSNAAREFSAGHPAPLPPR